MTLHRLVPGILFLAACGPASPSSSAASHHPSSVVLIDREFVLGAGQTARLENSPLTISFLRVDEDSRCARGVVCVWAGNARTSLEVTVGEGKPENISLNTLVNPQSQEVRGYMLRLIALSDHPVEGDGTDYKATLRLSRVTP